MPKRKKTIVTDPDQLLAELKKKLGDNPELLSLVGQLELSTSKPKPKHQKIGGVLNKPGPKKPAAKKKAKKVKPEPVQETESEFETRGTQFESNNEEPRTRPTIDKEKQKPVKFAKYQPPKGPNLFTDNRMDARDAEDERLKALNVVVKTQRREFKHVTVTCSECNGKEEVHPMYKTEFFRCTKCVKRR